MNCLLRILYFSHLLSALTVFNFISSLHGQVHLDDFSCTYFFFHDGFFKKVCFEIRSHVARLAFGSPGSSSSPGLLILLPLSSECSAHKLLLIPCGNVLVLPSCLLPLLPWEWPKPCLSNCSLLLHTLPSVCMAPSIPHWAGLSSKGSSQRVSQLEKSKCL